MNTKKTILAVGSIAFDSIKTSHGSRDMIFGGSATYFSIAASLFTNVKMVGIVGKDYPKKQLDKYNARGINTDNVQTVDGKTFSWGGRYSSDYNNRETLFTNLGVFESFLPQIKSDDCNTPIIFLGNIQPELQLDVIYKTLSPELIVSDTMNLWIEKSPNLVNKVIEKSNVLLINHEESEQITNISNIVAAAQIFHNMGVDCVVIKRGADGAYVSNKGEGCHIPVFPIKNLIDPTGAGDSFAGGFLGYIATSKNFNFIEACIAGTAAASFCVEGFGQEVLISANRQDLDARINIIKNILNKDN